MSGLKTIALVTLIACLLLTPSAKAQASIDDQLVCAAIHPCNDDGSVLPQFNVGLCAEHYRAECAKESLEFSRNQISQCANENTNLTKQIRRLTKKLRRAHARKSRS